MTTVYNNCGMLPTHLALPLTVLMGSGFMIHFTLMNTLLQLQVSDEMRGRVMGFYMLALFGVSPFGNLIIGRLAEAWSLTWAIGLSAVVTLGFSMVILALVPRVRHLP
jgi:MFS family permease